MSGSSLIRLSVSFAMTILSLSLVTAKVRFAGQQFDESSRDAFLGIGMINEAF